MSDIIAAVILGIVEGLTEFIPVSSTGHLIIAGEWIGFTGERAEVFEVFIQLGAILAVLFLYSGRFTGLLNFNSKVAFEGLDGAIKIAVATIPALICGALFHKAIKEYLFSSRTVAIALIVGGMLLIMMERMISKDRRYKKVSDLTVGTCLLIGLFQCLSLWPGVSRAGATVAGGLILGASRAAAAEFSFIVAVPVMCAAVFYDLYKSWGVLGAGDLPVFTVGFFVSFLTAILAIKTFIRFLNSHTLVPFGYYRIVFGLFVLWTAL